jgi:hypothetical protein
MSKTTASEAQISRSIMDYLAARHVFAVRMNSGTQVLTSGGNRRAIHMNAPGTADILAFPQIRIFSKVSNGVITPLPVWIEVKSATGKQSELQKSFQLQVEAEGHKYVLARSISDVEAAL